jgi:hypothetical protein
VAQWLGDGWSSASPGLESGHDALVFQEVGVIGGYLRETLLIEGDGFVGKALGSGEEGRANGSPLFKGVKDAPVM